MQIRNRQGPPRRRLHPRLQHMAQDGKVTSFDRESVNRPVRLSLCLGSHLLPTENNGETQAMPLALLLEIKYGNQTTRH